MMMTDIIKIVYIQRIPDPVAKVVSDLGRLQKGAGGLYPCRSEKRMGFDSLNRTASGCCDRWRQTVVGPLGPHVVKAS